MTVDKKTLQAWASEAGYDLTNDAKVENISPEQEATLPGYVEKWVNKARTTEPIDQIETAKWVGRAYQVAGLEVPEIIYCVSPKEAAAEIEKRGGDKSLVYQASFKGNHESYWVSYYDCLCELFGITSALEVIPQVEIAKHGGWVVLTDEVAVMIERPSELHFNEDFELHNTDGMACKWPDGFGFYTWNGKAVEGWIIETPEKITKEQVMNETDADLQNILAEQYGWHKLLNEIGAKVLDTRENPVENTIEVLTTSQFGVKLMATCPTGRVMTMPVPNDTKTCAAAQTWLGSEDGYDLDVNVIGRT